MSPGPVRWVERRWSLGTFAHRLDPFLDPALGVLAAGLALTSFLTSDVRAVDPRLLPPDAVGGIATVIAAASLGWRRSRPRTSYAVFLAGALVVSASGHYIGLLSVLLLISLYSLTTCVSRREAALGLAAGAACFVGLAVAGVPDLRAKDLALALALLVVAWAVGEVVRARRDVQRDQLRTVVVEERLRIARELHDVVAHSMSLIAVQAGVGAHLIDTDPAAAGQALEVIGETSRKALEQTRAMLGMLREEDESGNRPPTQGLDDLPTLVEDVRAAGVSVELRRSGVAAELDPAGSLAAYRIVQESLTNVIKHSAAAAATVSVSGSARQLEIEVRDPGPARSHVTGASGHGLIGLDERVRLVGGTLVYGPHQDGFRVRAALPTGAHR